MRRLLQINLDFGKYLINLLWGRFKITCSEFWLHTFDVSMRMSKCHRALMYNITYMTLVIKMFGCNHSKSFKSLLSIPLVIPRFMPY